MRHELHLLQEHREEYPELVHVAEHFVILATLAGGPRTVYELSVVAGETLQETHRAIGLLEREGRVKRITASDGRRLIAREG